MKIYFVTVLLWKMISLESLFLKSSKIRITMNLNFCRPLGGGRRAMIRTSSITQQIWYMHCVIASLVPDMVTARSVELGSISEATWIDAPVTSRISLILEPPLPIKEPHWEAGTISLSVIGGLETPPPPPAPPPWMSWNWEHHSSNFLHINVNALKMEFVGPVTVTIRSGQEPSEMLIFAPDCVVRMENYYRS